jgi:small subunit ribosomal protein S20
LANHKSAEKRARQSLRRRDRNRGVRGEVRTRVKAVRIALETGDAEAARERLHEAERALRKAATKGVIPKSTASRRVSRLARAVHARSASA